MNTTATAKCDLVQATENWVNEVVVRHRLCPFAKPVLNQGLVTYRVLPESDTAAVLASFADAVAAIINEAPEDATELLVLANAGDEFDDFLDICAMAEALLESMQWEQAIQLATFHPRYQFANTDPNDAENFTNRAPWPVIQLLQVGAVGRAIDSVDGVDDIPSRNIATLNALDEDALDALIQASTARQ